MTKLHLLGLFQVSKSAFSINVPISDISVALVSSGTSSASATAVILLHFSSHFIVWEDICSVAFHLWHTDSSPKNPSKAAAVRLMRLGYDSALSGDVSNQAE